MNKENDIQGPWKVVYVNSRAEKKVGLALLQKGIDCYVPLKKEMKQWSDRRKIVVSPLINGYVFVRPTARQRDEVLLQAGVVQYVKYNGADAIVKPAEIEALKSVETKGYAAEGYFGGDLEIGDSAVIRFGPFKGLKGTVLPGVSEDIYNLAIESINYCLKLKVPKEILDKASKNAF